MKGGDTEGNPSFMRKQVIKLHFFLHIYNQENHLFLKKYFRGACKNYCCISALTMSSYNSAHFAIRNYHAKSSQGSSSVTSNKIRDAKKQSNISVGHEPY